MPTKLEKEVAPCSNLIECKLKAFEVWDNICGEGIEDTTTASPPLNSPPPHNQILTNGTKEKTVVIVEREKNASEIIEGLDLLVVNGTLPA